ncbi:metal ABC transporter solute-binding protein, Zn/Mn family [Oceanobacillus alkalisoli]|uniref:metal ABC transporter solute-binding protein, Zn/Mn family n=1 Tax=Oceanobacillus alkalisoli TaxID=2925113 RepID=UPI001F119F17|nr:zinc ABC transporter substrate-binding protein [Oceanobacillus alkalisoli]MCF3943225.1 zinc ABC transporter substrate-binding protein [Oceanobacillus alkalisoli]
MKVLKRIFSFLLLLFILASCGTKNDTDHSNGTIYTTIYPLQFIVEEIAGDAVEVHSVYPPGVDEHTYEPTAKDLTEIAEGDAFFYIGAGLEALASTAAGALEDERVNLFEIGKHESLFLADEKENHDDHEDHDHHHGDKDPHIWLDPIRMTQIAEIIYDELSELYPDEQERFNENLTDLKAELEKVDKEFTELLDTKTNKKILVTHAAFGYWEERYGIEQVSIHGLSTENEPSQKDLIAIVDTAKENNINHIIFEQNVTTRVSEVIQNEVGAEALMIHNLAVLTDEDITENRNYFSIMRDNLEVLNEAMN